MWSSDLDAPVPLASIVLNVNMGRHLEGSKLPPHVRGQVLETVQLFRAKVVDVATDAVTIEATGDSGKLTAMLNVLEPFGIREIAQSGRVAIGRGSRSITDRTLRAVPGVQAG